jgi:DDE superfamily endonuclease
MSHASFNKLLSYIRHNLEVDQVQGSQCGGAILPEIRLYCTIRWLTGGSYSDIYMFVGISKPSFYRVCWETILALYRCPKLQIRFPQMLEECQIAADNFASFSRSEAIINCVGAVDGFLLEISAPAEGLVANVRSYYSGHYKCYGVNVQACCDHLSCFTYIAITSPGVMNDIQAKDEIDLGKLIESIPPLAFVSLVMLPMACRNV